MVALNPPSGPEYRLNISWRALTAALHVCSPTLMQKYHVIPEGAYLKADLSDGQKLDTAAGVPVTVSLGCLSMRCTAMYQHIMVSLEGQPESLSVLLHASAICNVLPT